MTTVILKTGVVQVLASGVVRAYEPGDEFKCDTAEANRLYERGLATPAKSK